MPTGSLRKKALKGVGWSTAESLLGKGVTFIVGIVLARLLSPAEYGMIGMAMVLVVILDSIADSGLAQAIIRKKTVTDDDLNTMFLAHLVVSVVMYAILFACAPLAETFFHTEGLTPVIRLLGIGIIIHALTYVQGTQLTRRIDFKSKTKATFTSAVVSGIVGITCAYSGLGVWALVIQRLVHQVVYSAALWYLNRWWPSFTFSMDSFKDMWGFGWKMMLVRLIESIWKELYQLVVGRIYSPATLGQYSRARQYARIFSTNITGIVQRVTYPTLAKIQDESERLIAGYRKIIKWTMFVTAISMFAMGAVAEPLIYCMIGSKWHEAATYLPLMCISMSLYPLHAINLNMIKVKGRSDIFLILEIIKKIIGIAPLAIGAFISIRWMLVASIFVGIINYFLNSYYAGKSLGYTSWMQMKDVAPSYMIATAVGASVYFFKYLPISNFIILPIQLVVAVFVFFAICESWKLEEYVEIKYLVQHEWSKIRKRF